MRHTHFVPAQNSRHRIAAIALYRALVRTGRQVPIPANVPQHGPRHPIAHVIRRRFDGHKEYTSLRLVYSAMTAGYKFLTILTKAQKEGSEEHEQVISHLQKRQSSPYRRKPESRPETTESKPTLLTKTSQMHTAPTYISDYKVRPDNRRAPLLRAFAEGGPFVQFKKGHSPLVSSIVGRKREAFLQTMGAMKEVEMHMAVECAWEDEWERLVEAQVLREQGPEACEKLAVEDADELYLWSAMVSKLWHEYKLEGMWEDWTARGEAMWDLVQREKTKTATEESTASQPIVPPPPHATQGQQMVRVDSQQKHLLLRVAYEAAAQARERGGGHLLEGPDPFVTPVWTDVVRIFDRRLRRWLGTIPGHDVRFALTETGVFDLEDWEHEHAPKRNDHSDAPTRSDDRGQGKIHQLRPKPSASKARGRSGDSFEDRFANRRGKN